MWSACDDDKHDWQHIPEWTARYKCTACGVLGYRGAVLATASRATSGLIISYRCPDCHGPTTHFRRKRVGELRGRDGAQHCPRCRR